MRAGVLLACVATAAAAASFWASFRRAGAGSGRARQVPRHDRRLHRLPHAGIFLRQARHGAPARAVREVGFEIPGLGVFHGPNLTPDKETGLGSWSNEEIVTALQTGARPDGALLAPIMPWKAFAQLTKDDAFAIAAFLKSIPAGEQQGAGSVRPAAKRRHRS